MKALVYQNNTLALDCHFPAPAPKPGEVLIRVLMSGICNTDLEIMNGYKDFSGVPGHEFAGIVEQARETNFIGKRVAGEINCPCNRCPTCLSGEPTHCPHRSALGILGRNGAMAEYCSLPRENLVTLPDRIATREAVFIEPLAAALEITQRLHIPPASSVMVIGDGKLGLLIAQTLRLTGCRLLVVGRHREKLEILRAMHIPVCLAGDLDPSSCQADTVVECTGHGGGFDLARRCVRPGGRLVLKSTFHRVPSVDLTSLVVDEIQVSGSRCGPFAPAVRLLEQGLVKVLPLIDREFALDHGVAAFRYAGEKGRLKVLINHQDIQNAEIG
ncbi:MAG TPA: alcohol dehydrogenase catalytic domain-containing protein [Desulfobacteraceae bacterium]|nr:alcohol dehydrogenase catalytic domain-containing protein [Desulfobacteraceae bacterium]